MNKKTIMMAALCVVGTAATAQLEKGKLFIGGSVGYFTRDSNAGFGTTKMRSHTIAPMAGYFINDNLAIGISLGYASSKDKNKDYPQEVSSYHLNPFIRHYLNISPEFKFFSEFRVGVGKGNSKATYTSEQQIYKRKNKYYGASLAPGLAFLPAKKWSVDLRFTLLDYEHAKVKDISLTSVDPKYLGSNRFSFGLNTISPSIGVNYHL